VKGIVKRVGKAAPVEIRRGSFVAKIYSKARTIRGRDYEVFTLSYYDPAGKRVLRDFGDFDKAKQAANDAATAFGLGRHDALQFKPEERQRFDAAERLLAPLGLNVYSAAAELVEARRKLPPGASLAEAVTFFADRHPANAPRMLVADVVAALVEDRTAAKCSERYVVRIAQGLERFSAAFHCPIGAITGPQVADWLRQLKGASGEDIGNRTRRNFFGHVRTLFQFALTRRWVSRDLADEISALPQPKTEAGGEVGTFTATEIRTLLEAADEETRTLLAVGAFAGLRTAEIVRLDWSAVRLTERVIIVGADKAKTASRRVVPISENLAAWLAPVIQRDGLLAGGLDDKAVTKRWDRLSQRLGVKWKHNGLRHSFISYRLAVAQDPAKVAFEAGNSPQMIHKHYKALTTEAQGREWFAVAPAHNQADILPMEAASRAA
jgi:integrase